MKTTLIFDCYGVISTSVAEVWGRKYFSEDQFKIITSEIVSKGDIGEYTDLEVYDNLSLLTGVPSEEIRHEWESLAHLREDLLEEIKRLKKKYHIVLLSNASRGFLEKSVLNRMNVDDYFDEIIVSSDICLIKPNVDIYTYALDKINKTALECVFIDDNPKNIEGAKKAHIDGIVFKNTEDFKNELEKLVNKN